jgi:hypothetical protein
MPRKSDYFALRADEQARITRRQKSESAAIQKRRGKLAKSLAENDRYARSGSVDPVELLSNDLLLAQGPHKTTLLDPLNEGREREIKLDVSRGGRKLSVGDTTDPAAPQFTVGKAEFQEVDLSQPDHRLNQILQKRGIDRILVVSQVDRTKSGHVRNWAAFGFDMSGKRPQVVAVEAQRLSFLGKPRK